MSSKAISKHPQGTEPARPPGWDAGPSVMREDDPGISRVVGGIGVCLVVLGGGILAFTYYRGEPTRFGVGWPVVFLVVGLTALLFHAAFDRDLQFRRLYMAF